MEHLCVSYLKSSNKILLCNVSVCFFVEKCTEKLLVRKNYETDCYFLRGLESVVVQFRYVDIICLCSYALG